MLDGCPIPPPTVPSPLRPYYVFLDEGGNLDFSPSGTRYFTLTGVAVRRPFAFDALTPLKFDLLEAELFEGEYFHASEDRQQIRDKVFECICKDLRLLRADSIIVDKCMAAPAVRADERFYPEMLGYLLRYVLKGLNPQTFSELIVITDQLPVKKKRDAVEKGIKQSLARMLPPGSKYRVLHHDSKSCCGLQVADYINWAIYRKWDSGDRRSYNLISAIVASQFDIFRNGVVRWYEHPRAAKK